MIDSRSPDSIGNDGQNSPEGSRTSTFSGPYPEEFDQERIRDMFELFHNQQRNDLAMEQQKILQEFDKLKVRLCSDLYFIHSILSTNHFNFFRAKMKLTKSNCHLLVETIK